VVFHSPSASPRPLRKGARQRVAIGFHHPAFGDQSGHEPRRGHVKTVIGAGEPSETIRIVSIRPSAVRPVMVETSSALRCSIGICRVPS
jgi:hypothetical protein